MFFKILKDECSVLDIKIIEKLAEKEDGAGYENLQSFIELVKKMSRVKTRIGILSNLFIYLFALYL